MNTTPLLTGNHRRTILVSDSAFSVATKNLESFLGNGILSGDPLPAVAIYN